MKKSVLLITAFLLIACNVGQLYTTSEEILTTFTLEDTKTYNNLIDDFKSGSLKSISSAQARILNHRKAIIEKEIIDYESSLLAKVSTVINGGFYLGIIGLFGKGLFNAGFFSPAWPYSNNIDRWMMAKRQAEGSFPFEEMVLLAKSEEQMLTPPEQEKLVQLQQKRKEFETSKPERLERFEKEYGKEKPQELIWDPPQYAFIEPSFNILLGLGIISLPFYVYKSYYLGKRKQEISLIDLILSQVLIIEVVVESLSSF